MPLVLTVRQTKYGSWTVPTEGHGVDILASGLARGHRQTGYAWKCVQCNQEQAGPLEDGCLHCGSGAPAKSPAPVAAKTSLGVKSGPPPLPARKREEADSVLDEVLPLNAAALSQEYSARIAQTPQGWRVELTDARRTVIGEGASLAEASASAEEALQEEVAVLFDAQGSPLRPEVQQAMSRALVFYLAHEVSADDPLRPTLEGWVLALTGEL